MQQAATLLLRKQSKSQLCHFDRKCCAPFFFLSKNSRQDRRIDSFHCFKIPLGVLGIKLMPRNNVALCINEFSITY